MQSRPVALFACDESSGSPRCHSFVQQHHCGFGLSKARHLSRFSTPLSPSIMKPSEALTIPMQHTPIPIIRMALERGGGVVHMRRPTCRARQLRPSFCLATGSRALLANFDFLQFE